jgi:hypothetical protein
VQFKSQLERAILASVAFLGATLPFYVLKTQGKLLGTWLSTTEAALGGILSVIGLGLEISVLRQSGKNDQRSRHVIILGLGLGLILIVQIQDDPKGYLASIITILTGAFIAVALGRANEKPTRASPRQNRRKSASK